jgi:hypothetical protein
VNHSSSSLLGYPNKIRDFGLQFSTIQCDIIVALDHLLWPSIGSFEIPTKDTPKLSSNSVTQGREKTIKFFLQKNFSVLFGGLF